MPKMDVIKKFMLWRIDIFQPTVTTEKILQPKPKVLATSIKKKQKMKKGKTTCLKCKKEHVLWKCPEFCSMPVKGRIKFITENDICKTFLAENFLERPIPRSYGNTV